MVSEEALDESREKCCNDSCTSKTSNGSEKYLNLDKHIIARRLMKRNKEHLCELNYLTKPRTFIDYNDICNYLKGKEIPCQKYNYTLETGM